MRLVEECQKVGGISPIDLNDGANAGDWVSMKNYNHCTIILYCAVGTAGSDPVITLDQATAVDGTDTKALNVTEIYHKVSTLLTTTSVFTRVTQTAADGYDSDPIAGGETENIIVIEVDRDQLDTDNDFDCLQADVAQMGAAKHGCVLYILSEPRYTGSDAIAD